MARRRKITAETLVNEESRKYRDRVGSWMNADGEEEIEDRGGVPAGFESEVRLKLNLDKSSARENERRRVIRRRDAVAPETKEGEKERKRDVKGKIWSYRGIAARRRVNKKKSAGSPERSTAIFLLCLTRHPQEPSNLARIGYRTIPLSSLVSVLRGPDGTGVLSSSFPPRPMILVVDGNCSDKCVRMPDIDNRRLSISPVVLMDKRPMSLREKCTIVVLCDS